MALYVGGKVAGGWKLIETIQMSGTHNAQFDDCFSGYNVNKMEISNAHPSGNGVTPQLEFNEPGNNDWATINFVNSKVYWYTAESGGGTGTSQTGQSQTTGELTVGQGVGGDADESLSGTVYMYGIHQATYQKHLRWHLVWSEESNNVMYQRGGAKLMYTNPSNRINGVRFSFSGNDIDSGTFSMHGMIDGS